MHIANAPTDALSGIHGLEWLWNTADIGPGAGTEAMRFQEYDDEDLNLGMSQYDYAIGALYIWVRALDKAGNKSAWVQWGGGSGFVNLGVREITGKYELLDLMELRRIF